MVLDTSTGLVPQAAGLQIDEAALRHYLAATVKDFPPDIDRLEVFQFSHGQSNPTYLVKAGNVSYVLRKKPPGRVLPSAHAVEREFQVLSALQATPVPVPVVVCLCEDSSVLGTPFYMMQHVRGRIFTDPSLPGVPPQERAAIYQAMARTLAALHNVRPNEVGLGNFGKASGYNRRQVWRWGQQYAQSVAQGKAMPEMQQLHSWLEAHIPPTDSDPAGTRISHGDFRLDNLVFDCRDPSRVLAVLDWELSTLGDPLADLAYSCMPYHLPADIPTLVSLPHPLPAGIPDEQQYIREYCTARGLPYPLQAPWPFYMALSIFRLAAILAGVGGRAAQGNASSRIAAQVGADSVVLSLAQKGLQIAGVLPGTEQGAPRSGNGSSRSIRSGGTGDGGGAHLMGTPTEPYINPKHPDAQPDDSPNILAGNELEEYANPSPAWRQAASKAATALEEADQLLPARAPPTSSGGARAARSNYSSGIQHQQQQPTRSSRSSGYNAGSSTAGSSSSSHLMGTPAEPYVNPKHPSAQPDDSPNIMAGNELEEYANPSPEWRQAASKAASALEEADKVLPPTTISSSGSSVHRQPTAGLVNSGNGSGVPTTAAQAAGMAATGLGPSPRVQPLLRKLHRFMEEHVYTAEATLNAHAMTDKRWTIHPLQERLKEEAKRQGLWNLWLPADMAAALERLISEACSSEDEKRLLLGPGLTNLEYAHCAEVMGRSVWAPECFNSSAPDTGNMEVLARYGSKEQQRRWLLPLLRGEVRSCFAMTEPAVASSDATNITASISREGDGYVLNGRKWWASGACDPRCKVAIFMGKTDPQAPTHKQQSMVLVPIDAPGVKVVRPLPVFGFDDAPHGHAEVVFEGVRVPAGNIILGEGRGFEIAQGRLGPGRLHHCMRLIGMGERALDLMLKRAEGRTAFKHKLSQHQSVRLDIARSRIELDAARLVVLQAALALDQVGNKEARGEIAAAKALAPSTVIAIIDRAIQVHGAAGVSDVTPLAHMFAGARTLRLADGPDVVHLETIAKLELVGARRARL